MANNIMCVVRTGQMVGGVPEADFDVWLDDGRMLATGAAIPWGSTILQANTAIIDAAKTACLATFSPPPVFDGTTKDMVLGGVLTGTGL